MAQIVIVSIKKNTKDILKKRTYGPNAASSIVWARFRHRRPFRRTFR